MVEGKLYLGAALTDTLRADVALVGHHQGEGWGYDPYLARRVGTERYWGARSKIVFEPNAMAKFTLSGDYLRNKDTSTLYYGIASESIQTGGFGPTPGHDSDVGDPGVGTDNRLYGGSFTAELKFDFATLTSISAIRRNSTFSTVAMPGSSQLLNAAKVKVDGFELEFEAAPTHGLSLYGGFTVLNSRFSRFGGPGALFQAPILYPNFGTTPTRCQPAALGLQDPGILGTGSRIGGFTTCLGDVSGNKTALAPKFSASAGATYTIELSGDRSLRLTGLYSYNSGFFFEPDNVVRQAAYSVVNASAEYRLNRRFGVQLWGRNLGDELYAAQKISSATGATATYAPPRTYGVTLNFDY